MTGMHAPEMRGVGRTPGNGNENGSRAEFWTEHKKKRNQDTKQRRETGNTKGIWKQTNQEDFPTRMDSGNNRRVIFLHESTMRG